MFEQQCKSIPDILKATQTPDKLEIQEVTQTNKNKTGSNHFDSNNPLEQKDQEILPNATHLEVDNLDSTQPLKRAKTGETSEPDL